MKLEKLIEKVGYENDAVKICKFLGFDDTDQLKNAKFFSQEETYSSVFDTNFCVNEDRFTWHLCQIIEDNYEPYSIDYGYKFYFEICDGKGYGKHLYSQSDFLSMLEEGTIIYSQDGKGHIEHIKWIEPLCNNVYLVNEADVIIKED